MPTAKRNTKVAKRSKLSTKSRSKTIKKPAGVATGQRKYSLHPLAHLAEYGHAKSSVIDYYRELMNNIEDFTYHTKRAMEQYNSSTGMFSRSGYGSSFATDTLKARLEQEIDRILHDAMKSNHKEFVEVVKRADSKLEAICSQYYPDILHPRIASYIDEARETGKEIDFLDPEWKIKDQNRDKIHTDEAWRGALTVVDRFEGKLKRCVRELAYDLHFDPCID